MLYHSLRYCHQCKIDDDGRDEAGDDIDEIMRLNIYGSQTQEDVEWQHNVKHFSVAGMPDQEHADGAHAHMRTWESGCRTLAGVLGVFYKLVEDSIGVARCRQAVGMGIEVIAQSREDAFGYF